MNTSNFRKAGRHPRAISIAQCAPVWFQGRSCRALAPPWTLVRDYRDTGDVAAYTARYEGILAGLDPRKVIAEVGEGAVLLCWEEPGAFCHRHLVAAWLRREAGIVVTEL